MTTPPCLEARALTLAHGGRVTSADLTVVVTAELVEEGWPWRTRLGLGGPVSP